MTYLYKFLCQENQKHPGLSVQIVKPVELAIMESVNDMILDMEVDYRYREKYNILVAEWQYVKCDNVLKVWLEEQNEPER